MNEGSGDKGGGELLYSLLSTEKGSIYTKLGELIQKQGVEYVCTEYGISKQELARFYLNVGSRKTYSVAQGIVDPNLRELWEYLEIDVHSLVMSEMMGEKEQKKPIYGLLYHIVKQIYDPGLFSEVLEFLKMFEFTAEDMVSGEYFALIPICSFSSLKLYKFKLLIKWFKKIGVSVDQFLQRAPDGQFPLEKLFEYRIERAISGIHDIFDHFLKEYHFDTDNFYQWGKDSSPAKSLVEFKNCSDFTVTKLFEETTKDFTPVNNEPTNEQKHVSVLRSYSHRPKLFFSEVKRQLLAAKAVIHKEDISDIERILAGNVDIFETALNNSNPELILPALLLTETPE